MRSDQPKDISSHPFQWTNITTGISWSIFTGNCYRIPVQNSWIWRDSFPILAVFFIPLLQIISKVSRFFSAYFIYSPNSRGQERQRM